jgi:TorA maturation chaperone TorD
LDGARSLSAAPEDIGLHSEPLPEEEVARADIYRLLAGLLAAPPDAAVIAALRRMSSEESELGDAFRGLARAAAGATADSAAREYHDLFIGVGRGELLPYASYYLTGFLHERPLADLRAALAGLGIARALDVAEPEDHIAFLCEVMAGLVTGAFGPAAPLAAQREFFDAFLAPWAPRFLADLEGAQAARLYAPLGRIGRLFFAIEQTAFAIA